MRTPARSRQRRAPGSLPVLEHVLEVEQLVVQTDAAVGISG
jgi:hypothetical protein